MPEKRLFRVPAIIALAILSAAATPAGGEGEAPARNDFRAAQSILERCESPDSAAALLALVELHHRAFRGEIDLLADAARSMSVRRRFGYANILLRVGRTREALLIYDGIVAESPAWACPWHKKGLAHRRLGEYEACTAAYRRAIELKPKDAGTRIALARVEFETGDFNGALEALRGGLSCAGIDMDDAGRRSVQPEIEFLCLEILRGCGRRDEARRQVERLRRIAPDDPRLADAESAADAGE